MPKEIDLPEDTPVPRAVRSEQYPPVSIQEKSPKSWRHSLRAVANEGKPKSRVQYIMAAAALVTAFGGGTGCSAFVSAFTGSKEVAEKLDKLSAEVAELKAEVRKGRDRESAHARRQDDRTELVAKAVYRINSGSPAYAWPKPDDDNWTVTADGRTHRTRQAWPIEPSE